MSGPIASSRVRSEQLRRLAPAAALLLVALVAGLSVGSSLLVARHLRAESLAASRIYSEAVHGQTNPAPDAATTALFTVVQRIVSLGFPLVLTDSSGHIEELVNVPFTRDVTDPRLPAYVRQLDRVNPPIVDSGRTILHYGPAPQTRVLTMLAVLQGLTILIMVTVAIIAYRSGTRAQRDRMWVAMAREAAHQMGTPLTSLQGWIEQVRNSGVSPARLADYLDGDAERLQRVAQRFERIGNPARRDPVGLGALAERVAGYYRPRLPHHANSIQLLVRAPSAGPVIMGDPVLLEWALEVMVKNAIDALQGRGGTITLATEATADAAYLRVSDDGPGVPREIRRTLFQPGVTTKRGGWGIGLALARRVIVDGHQGTLALEPTTKGTTFLMRFPAPATQA